MFPATRLTCSTATPARDGMNEGKLFVTIEQVEPGRPSAGGFTCANFSAAVLGIRHAQDFSLCHVMPNRHRPCWLLAGILGAIESVAILSTVSLFACVVCQWSERGTLSSTYNLCLLVAQVETSIYPTPPGQKGWLAVCVVAVLALVSAHGLGLSGGSASRTWR